MRHELLRRDARIRDLPPFAQPDSSSEVRAPTPGRYTRAGKQWLRLELVPRCLDAGNDFCHAGGDHREGNGPLRSSRCAHSGRRRLQQALAGFLFCSDLTQLFDHSDARCLSSCGCPFRRSGGFWLASGESEAPQLFEIFSATVIVERRAEELLGEQGVGRDDL